MFFKWTMSEIYVVPSGIWLRKNNVTVSSVYIHNICMKRLGCKINFLNSIKHNFRKIGKTIINLKLQNKTDDCLYYKFFFRALSNFYVFFLISLIFIISLQKDKYNLILSIIKGIGGIEGQEGSASLRN